MVGMCEVVGILSEYYKTKKKCIRRERIYNISKLVCLMFYRLVQCVCVYVFRATKIG